MQEEQFIFINEVGIKFYFKDRTMKIRHRLDGPAIECLDGYKVWYIDGKMHRLDGPAIVYTDGSKEWYIDGKRHRLDGPAVECADGDKVWFINGKYLIEEEFIDLTSPKPVALTLDQIAAKFGIRVDNLKIVK
jgi:hypothetical protein